MLLGCLPVPENSKTPEKSRISQKKARESRIPRRILQNLSKEYVS
jgi:hypothetical protein